MKKRSTTLKVILAATVAAMGLAGCAGNNAAVKADQAAPEAVKAADAAPAAKAREIKRVPLPPGVEAMVNATAITANEVNQLTKAMLSRQPTMGPPPAPEIVEQTRNAAIEQLINAELLYQAGSKLEIADLDKTLEAEYEKETKRFASKEEMDKALKSANMEEKDLRLLIRKRYVVNNLLEKEIAPAIVVGEDEIKKFYDDNQDKFKRPEAVRASHILVESKPDATPEQDKAAREKIEGLLKQLKEGKDFAELAKVESSCPSKVQGGDLNFFTKGQMVPEFENAAFALKPGEISDIVKTQFGYHIIKFTDRQPEGVVPFDEVKPRIESYLKETKGQKAVADYIEKQKDGAIILHAVKLQ
jgi:peptidyl-prolyl cis-trans isomerase C